METPASSRQQVCVVGGGSFGTAVACVAAEGARCQPESFCEKVRLWVRREELASEINNEHTNKQYYPGSLPENIVASSDLVEVVSKADIVVIAVPADFLEPTLQALKAVPSITSSILVSVLKSLRIVDGQVLPFVRRFTQLFPSCPIAALMGPNLFREMARGEFAEATIGVTDAKAASVLSSLFSTSLFHVKCISDIEAVDMCGCLKNTFTLACGFAEGLGWGGNVRAAIIRRGLLEIAAFVEEFLPRSRPGCLPANSVVLEACGIGDLIVSCTVGRGRSLAAEFVKQKGRSWEDLEDALMGGMRIPDLHNVQEVYALLQSKGRLDAYPLLAQTHAITFAGAEPASILTALRTDRSAGVTVDPQPLRLDFSGKRAFVTGASSGIGRAIAVALLQHGAAVIAVDRQAQNLPGCEFLSCDLQSVEAMREVVAKAGDVDLLVNCAGIAVFQQWGEQTPEIWDTTMDINARAVWFLTHELGRGMAARGSGAVVNISSQSSSVAVSERHLAYSTSKAAVDHITRMAAYALAKSNVRVNAVNPTVVRTDLALKAHGEEGLAKMAAKVPLGRVCEPQDVADAVLYLLSDRARMITGVTLPVDGGFLAARA